jgi:hypothetical protein
VPRTRRSSVDATRRQPACRALAHVRLSLPLLAPDHGTCPLWARSRHSLDVIDLHLITVGTVRFYRRLKLEPDLYLRLVAREVRRIGRYASCCLTCGPASCFTRPFKVGFWTRGCPTRQFGCSVTPGSCLLLAQADIPDRRIECPLSEVERT